jgi:hypothetical protein
MSFRKEEKLHIHKSQLINLLSWIYDNDGCKLYDSRVVSSTYFDNENMQMHKDSEEGCSPRKKVRIRSYSRNSHTDSNSKLEIKTSAVEGRYKTSQKQFNIKKYINKGFFDADYGICNPKVRVTYQRDYFKIHHVRMTVDRQIEYMQLNSLGKAIYKTYEPDIVVEIKAEDFVPIEYLFNKFQFNRVRFSKYSRAINSFS